MCDLKLLESSDYSSSKIAMDIIRAAREARLPIEDGRWYEFSILVSPSGDGVIHAHASLVPARELTRKKP